MEKTMKTRSTMITIAAIDSGGQATTTTTKAKTAIDIGAQNGTATGVQQQGGSHL